MFALENTQVLSVLVSKTLVSSQKHHAACCPAWNHTGTNSQAFLSPQAAPQTPALFSKWFCPKQSSCRSELQAGLNLGTIHPNLWPWQCSTRGISGLNSASFLLEMHPNSPPKPRHGRKKVLTLGKLFAAYSCY